MASHPGLGPDDEQDVEPVAAKAQRLAASDMQIERAKVFAVLAVAAAVEAAGKTIAKALTKR